MPSPDGVGPLGAGSACAPSGAGGGHGRHGHESVAREVRVVGLIAAAHSRDGERAGLDCVPASEIQRVELGALVDTPWLLAHEARELEAAFSLVGASGRRIELLAVPTAQAGGSAWLTAARTFERGELEAGAWTLSLRVLGVVVGRQGVRVAGADDVAADLQPVAIRAEALGVGDAAARLLPVDGSPALALHVEAAPRVLTLARSERPAGFVTVQDSRGDVAAHVPFELVPRAGSRTFSTAGPVRVALPQRAGSFRLEVQLGGRVVFRDSVEVVSARELLGALRVDRVELVALAPGRTWVVGRQLVARDLEARLVAVARLSLGDRAVAGVRLPLRVAVRDERGTEVFAAEGVAVTTGPTLDVYAPAIPLVDVVPRVVEALEVRLTVGDRELLSRRITLRRLLSFTGEGEIVGEVPREADPAAAAAALAFFEREGPRRRAARRKPAPRRR